MPMMEPRQRKNRKARVQNSRAATTELDPDSRASKPKARRHTGEASKPAIDPDLHYKTNIINGKHNLGSHSQE